MDVEELSVLDAVKDLLEFSETTNNNKLEAELEIALEQSDIWNLCPCHVICDEVRNQYKNELFNKSPLSDEP